MPHEPSSPAAPGHEASKPTERRVGPDVTQGSRPFNAHEFELFVEEHYRSAYRFAFSLCGKHEDACDITQQAFYIAQTRDHQLRDASKRKPWLFTILHREFLSSRRRHTQYPETNLESVESELPPITVDHAASLDARTVLSVLQTLEESFKSVLALFYLEQLSYKEIAEVLEIPIGTVMSRLARGKQMLRQLLERTRVEHAGRIRPLGAAATREADHG